MLSKKLIKAAAGNAAEETDENFNQTVLLLHGDGTDGAQNNTFLDSGTANSGSGFTITRNGNTTQGTFSPFSAPDGRWANYFPSSTISVNQKLSGTLPSGLGTGNFSFEFFVWWIASPTGADGIFYDGGANGVTIIVNVSGQMAIGYRNGAGSFQSLIAAGAGTAVTKNAWTHVQLIRSGTGANQTVLYINGVSAATTTLSYDLTSTSANICGRFAVDGSNWYPFQGYLANYRVSNTNRSAGVPTSPLTSDANTLLLTCQSNRFIDADATPITITKNGSTSISPFSPFAPTAAYDASVNGGSGYFGGTSLVYAPVTSELQMGTGEFTIEGWIYLNAVGSQYGVYSSISSGASNWTGCAIDITSDKVRGIIYTTSGALVGTVSHQTVLTAGQWYHFALVRASGVVKVYVDGVVSNTTLSTTTTLGQNGTAVGAYYVGTNNRPVNGYLADVRVLKGTAIDFASTGIPTAPLTNITNTKLLLNFTNAGIYDNTGKNNLESVADVQLDVTTKKFGTAAIQFDSVGDYLLFPSTENFTLGTGDWSIQFWLRVNNLPSGSLDAIFDTRPASTQGIYPNLYIDTDGKIKYWVNSADRITATNALSTNTWYFVSLIKESGNTKLFIDGTQSGSTYSDSNNYIASRLIIGGSYGGGASIAYSLDGFLDDFRWTKGVARDGTVVPTKAFPDL